MAGRPHRIPAGSLPDHLRALLASGLSMRQIARAAGTDPGTVRNLLNGQKEVLRTRAERLLAVSPAVRVSHGDVPSVGAIRRIRALYRLGYSPGEIAVGAGVAHKTVLDLASARRKTVSVRVHDGLKVAYDWFSMSSGTCLRTSQRAAAEGWAPPLAWDDDTIDDPAAEPQIDPAAPSKPTEGGNVVDRWLMGESVILGRDARRQAICHLMEWTNLTTDEVAERLDMNTEAVSAAWERAKRKARTEEGRRLWRRAYIPRERNLTKTDMEEVA